MAELILTILLLVSLFGMVFILYRKIPVLVNLSETSQELFQVSEIIERAKEKSKEGVRKIPGASKSDRELLLQKILSKIRVLTLKTENRTGVWLEKLRKKRNNHDKDDYWQKLKNIKD